MIKALLALVLFSSVSYGKTLKPKTVQELRNSSVMILNSEMNSGGTGSVLRSSQEGSEILTNKHVCEVVQEGGVVFKNEAFYPVVGYKEYKNHDLCLVKIKNNLNINLVVAKTKALPAATVNVSGHPNLLPHITTRGHLSDEVEIGLITGIRECTKQDLIDHPLECAFIGGIPVIETFASVVVSNLIKPGSSGSAVFNAKGEIVGVVFAGTGRDFSHGFIVPQRYVKRFVARSAKMQWTKPQPRPDKPEETSHFDFEKCNISDFIINSTLRKFCKTIKDPMIWRK